MKCFLMERIEKLKGIKKPANMLCGPACILFLEKILKVEVEIPYQLQWMTDIALFIRNKLGVDARLSCYRSRLYKDYIWYKKDGELEFEGFIKLDNYCNYSGDLITEKKVTCQYLERRLSKNSIFLLNVASSIIHNDASFSGGHFIVLIGYDERSFLVANPGKTMIHLSSIPKKTIIDALVSFGSWVLEIPIGQESGK